jgi:hypothetical protein
MRLAKCSLPRKQWQAGRKRDVLAMGSVDQRPNSNLGALRHGARPAVSIRTENQFSLSVLNKPVFAPLIEPAPGRVDFRQNAGEDRD